MATTKALRGTRQMILGMELGNTSGTQPASWRAPGVDPLEYLNYDARIGYAQAAERGKLQFLFFPGGPHPVDIEHDAPQHSPDLGIHMALRARATERIGLVASGSTSFNPPFTLAQQLKTVDYVSHGRVGWNVVPSARPGSNARRGLFHRDYEGTTLREHLGTRDQYGPDYRVAQTAKPNHTTRPFATVNR